MTSDSRRSGLGTTQQVSLGAPSVLIVRLRGDVFPIETTKSIIERNKELDILSEFVVPESQAFVPPVGQKFFDPVYLEAQKALHSRGKVNFSLIKNRDAELRGITEVIADALFKSILTTSSIKDYCRGTLSGVNEFAVDIPDSSYGRTSLPANAESGQKDRRDDGSHVAVLSDNVSYGVYFREIQVAPPLLQRLVVELKHLGVLHSAPTLLPLLLEGGPELAKSDPADVVNPFSGAVMDQWTTAGDKVLAAKAELVTFPFQMTAKVLNSLGISSANDGPEDKGMYEAILAR